MKSRIFTRRERICITTTKFLSPLSMNKYYQRPFRSPWSWDGVIMERITGERKHMISFYNIYCNGSSYR